MVWGGLVWLHRWTGIAVCLLLALWFASGMVMLYVPFPSLPAADRYDGAEPFDLAQVAVSPAAALAALPGAARLWLRARDGQIVYVVRNSSETAVLDATSGARLPAIDGDAAGRIAARFSGSPIQHVDASVAFDQWIVHEGFAADRPYHRVSIADDSGTTLYVSTTTGEVRQRTGRLQRMWNSVGAIPHWLYWTVIRKHWSFWDSLVWWLSLVALFCAFLGLLVGVYRYTQSRVRGGSGWKVFVSWWRWHHVLGLTAGLFLLGWIASGWLSMDHGRLFSRATVPADVKERMAGASLEQAAAAISTATLQAAGRGVEAEVRVANGQPFLLVRRSATEVGIVSAAGDEWPSLPVTWLEAGLRAAFPEESALRRVQMPTQDLYARAEELPASARLFVLPGPPVRRAYVDPLSGELLGLQDPGPESLRVALLCSPHVQVSGSGREGRVAQVHHARAAASRARIEPHRHGHAVGSD